MANKVCPQCDDVIIPVDPLIYVCHTCQAINNEEFERLLEETESAHQEDLRIRNRDKQK